jgi:hypothetical protein
MRSVLPAGEDRDGGFGRGGWVLSCVDQAVERFKSEATTGAGALLLGRSMYEIFAATWPHADMDDPAVAAMNAVPEYVASKPAGDPSRANSVLLGAGPAEEVSRIKAASESEPVVPGGGGCSAPWSSTASSTSTCCWSFLSSRAAGGSSSPMARSPRRPALAATRPTPSGVLINTYRRRAEGCGPGSPRRPDEDGREVESGEVKGWPSCRCSPLGSGRRGCPGAGGVRVGRGVWVDRPDAALAQMLADSAGGACPVGQDHVGRDPGPARWPRHSQTGHDLGERGCVAPPGRAG